MDLLKTSPDPERAKSLIAMAALRLEAIARLRPELALFASKITEEYYDALLELATACLAKDGRKTPADQPGGHRATLTYLHRFPALTEADHALAEELRKRRVGVKYYGRAVPPEFLRRREPDIKALLKKLKAIAEAPT